jgi:signal transduction histidine kinase
MVARAAEERTIAQMQTLARAVESLNLSFAPGPLQYIRSASGAELVVSTPEGLAPNLSTVDGAAFSGLGAKIAADPAFAKAGAAELALPDGRSFVVVRASMADRRDLYLLTSGQVLAEKGREAAGPLIVLSALGLIAVVTVGFWVASGIARPIEDLARHARQVVDLKAERPLDVTGGAIETKHLVEALNRMLETLRAAQQKSLDAQRAVVIREMAASVAHEIKNPLQAIQMIVQTSEAMPDKDKKMLLDEIRRVELASLELLSLAGPGKLKLEKASLASIVDRTLDLLSRPLKHRGVTVERIVEGNGTLELDADRIQRAVMNLVLNGAQAMPQGGPLTVRVDRGKVSVTDRGPGIPPEIRARLFEPFVTGKQDGVGLGLFVTKTIVEQHGGRMGLDTGPGGTTVYFEIPG